MSSSVVGFKPPDAKWLVMKQAWDSCQAAGVPAPKEVSEFFEYEAPDSDGVVVDEEALLRCGALVEYVDDGESGFTLHVDKLPADVKIVRFMNCW